MHGNHIPHIVVLCSDGIGTNNTYRESLQFDHNNFCHIASYASYKTNACVSVQVNV